MARTSNVARVCENEESGTAPGVQTDCRSSAGREEAFRPSWHPWGKSLPLPTERYETREAHSTMPKFFQIFGAPPGPVVFRMSPMAPRRPRGDAGFR
jgi:hypothetical protein